MAGGSALEGRYVDARGVRAFVRVSERAGGLPVVLVHGLVISSLYMVPTARGRGHAG